jgi:2-polyprenyl-3-methyl-5-hydroxy-6-metoxy-1,4-benzoquinol methylase
MPKSRDDYAVHYAQWHDTSAAHRKYMSNFYSSAFEQDLVDAATRLQKPLRDLKILDFGCGMGLLLSFCRDLGITNLRGFEIDANQAKIARELGLAIENSNDPSNWLSECTEKFDVILSIDVIEHIEPGHADVTLKAMRRLLEDSGTLIVTVPNANSSVAARWRYIDLTHRTSFTEHSLRHLLLSSGFSAVTVKESEIVRFYGEKRSLFERVSERLCCKIFRSFRRLELIGEFGWHEGAVMPITVNIKAVSWESRVAQN